MRKILNNYIEREMNKRKWMLRLAGLFGSIALALLVAFCVMLTGCISYSTVQPGAVVVECDASCEEVEEQVIETVLWEVRDDKIYPE